jgi:uncharacterized protein
MAHQCLQCGHLFQEGPSAILQGCPQCKGTRFFYTQKPLAESERRSMAEKAQKDLREVVGEILKSSPASSEDLQRKVQAGGWAQLRPADLRSLVQAAAQKQTNAAAALDQARTWENPEVRPALRKQVEALEAKRAAVAAEVAEASKAPDHPDTVNIRKPGEYEIDVAGLLERNPIVVHRDGAYHIHLASLFDSAGKQ